MQRILAYLRGLLRLEDAMLMAIPFMLVFLAHKPQLLELIEKWLGSGTLFGANTVLLLVAGAGFWACLGSRPEPDPLEGLSVWRRLHLYAAYAGVIVGVPILGLLVADGRSGYVYLWAALFALLSAGALGFSFTDRVLKVVPKVRRFWMLPFLVLASWNCLSMMTEQFLYGDRHVDRLVVSLGDGNLVELGALLVEYGFMACLFSVPYVLLVIFPRFVGGEMDSPWVWIQRYVCFQLSLLGGLLYASGLSWLAQ